MSPLEFAHNHSLLSQNSLGVPAVCASYTEVSEGNQLTPVIEHANRRGLSIFVLGEGTNLVLSQDIQSLVVKANILGKEIVEENSEHVKLRIGAGENWHELVNWTLEQGYYGLENLALIPGSCGAAPVQNIGAYGVQISRYISSVEYVEFVTRTLKKLTGKQCLFDYRESIFKNDLADRALITHVELNLAKTPSINKDYPAVADYLEQRELPDTPQAVFQAVCAVRKSKLPDIKAIPNAGSFFKNPVISREKYTSLLNKHPELPGYSQRDENLEDMDTADIKVPAAWLIDRSGWKGKLKNGVGVYDKQALVIINPGHRTGRDILEFARRITQSVKKKFGISLEVEPRIVD